MKERTREGEAVRVCASLSPALGVYDARHELPVTCPARHSMHDHHTQRTALGCSRRIQLGLHVWQSVDKIEEIRENSLDNLDYTESTKTRIYGGSDTHSTTSLTQMKGSARVLMPPTFLSAYLNRLVLRGGILKRTGTV